MKVTPVAIGTVGAVFTVTLLSVSSDFDFAVEKIARLFVDGNEWRPAT